MAELPTLGMLSITDGRLMSDIGDVYEVVSHFIGRPAYTHELPGYAPAISKIVVAEFPGLAGDESRPWEALRDAAIAKHGERMIIPDAWAESIADGKRPMETLRDALIRVGKEE